MRRWKGLSHVWLGVEVERWRREGPHPDHARRMKVLSKHWGQAWLQEEALQRVEKAAGQPKPRADVRVIDVGRLRTQSRPVPFQRM